MGARVSASGTDCPSVRHPRQTLSGQARDGVGQGAIVLPMPVSVNRARVPSRGRLISSSEYRDWKTAAAWRVRVSGVRASAYPVAVEIEVHTTNARRDVDNVVKPCLDALVAGGALDDDNIAHVSAITVRARRAHTESVTVRIQETHER